MARVGFSSPRSAAEGASGRCPGEAEQRDEDKRGLQVPSVCVAPQEAFVR